jgi:hypothetical protein
MRKAIFKLCQKLYFRKILPWKLWSPIYDKWHRIALTDD